jgi:hypothetical protein
MVSDMRRRIVSCHDAKEVPNAAAAGTAARCELDAHADTCCAGKNFVPIHFTGQVCEVSGFSPELGTVNQVPVARAATVWSDPATGLHCLLAFNEILWFGSAMGNSLINPNLLRHGGIMVCDDPTDRNRKFGVEISDSIFAPLEMEGTVVHLGPTRAPDQKELNELPRIIVTDDAEWDPSTVAIRKLSKEEEKLRLVSSLRISSAEVTNTECLGRPTHSEIDVGLAQMCSRRLGK